MSTVILSAASAQVPSLQALSEVLCAELRQQGQTELHNFELCDMKLAYCQGEFDCWVKTPGICKAKDAEQTIVQAIHDAENLVILDEVTFGAHSYTVKRAQDRLICLLSPFFEKRSLLTHHSARYEHMSNFFALGWMPLPNKERAETWHRLAEANAVNMLAPRVGSLVVDNLEPKLWPSLVCNMLSSVEVPGATIHARGPLREALLLAAHADHPLKPFGKPKKVALLVGSAKPKGTSVSETLARAMAVRFEKAAVATEVHFVTEFLHKEHGVMAGRAIAEADLFILVSPLYVDSLPALAVQALEQIAKARTALSGRARFAAVVNCGFPEPEHNRTAMRITRHFAESADYHWAGGLPLGGGGMVKPDVALDSQHGPIEHIKTALDLASYALARGEDVSIEAVAAMIQTAIPDVAYRLMGDLGWRYQAHKQGIKQEVLRDRPLDE